MSNKTPFDSTVDIPVETKKAPVAKAKPAVDLNYDDMTVDQLEELLGEERVSHIEGSGANGNVLKKDLVKAAKGA